MKKTAKTQKKKTTVGAATKKAARKTRPQNKNKIAELKRNVAELIKYRNAQTEHSKKLLDEKNNALADLKIERKATEEFERLLNNANKRTNELQISFNQLQNDKETTERKWRELFEENEKLKEREKKFIHMNDEYEKSIAQLTMDLQHANARLDEKSFVSGSRQAMDIDQKAIDESIKNSLKYLSSEYGDQIDAKGARVGNYFHEDELQLEKIKAQNYESATNHLIEALSLIKQAKQIDE